LENNTSKLIFPAKPDYIRALRLAAAAVASQAGFNIDEIEDLKLLTSQAFIFLMLEKSRYVKVDITENKCSLKITFYAMEYHDGPFEMENENVLRKALLKSLTRKRCMIEKGKVAACIIPNALNGCQNLQTY
jgi:serine/threonine-protein kinase RsbW